MRPFEQKIVLEFKGAEGRPGMGKMAFRTRPWVLGHLAEQEDYGWGMFKRYREFCVENGLPISTYPSFYMMLYKLLHEGLIARTKREEGVRNFQERQYWKVA